MDSSNNLRKRLYQNLLNKEPKQNHLLGSTTNTKSAILKPKVVQDLLNNTAKLSSPVFQKGKIRMQTQMKSPQVPKKIAPLINKDKLSKEGKAIVEEGKLKSKANLKPHDIFAFYESFPEMSEDFFYLNRVGHPYDYQIVTYSQRNPMEYMTISFKGVTLYHEKEAQFMTKDEWLEDEKIYYALQRIEFFKQYKISKNFTIWKNRMRRHYMKEMSNLLNQGLFFSYEHPRSCLLEVRKVTNHLKEGIYFMPCNSMESEDPQQFKANAEEYIKNNFMAKVKEVEEMVIEQLEIAINEEIKKFKVQNNIKINDVGDHDKKDHKEGYVYSQEAILRKQYKKVNKLIKLADNIILESKIQLFHNCLLELIQKIEQVRSSDSKSEWIKCTARLVENDKSGSSIEWNPTLEGLKTIFKDLINLAVVKMSDEHEKISMHEKFQKYRANQENDNRKDQKRNTLKYLIQDSLFYAPLLKRIETYLEEEFHKTKKQEEQMVKFINIYQKHKQLPGIKEIFKVHSASQYIHLVREWRQDDVDMHMLPVNKSGGLLIFDYSLLRSTMHEIPKKTLNSFLAQLPEETKKKYNELVSESQGHLEEINNYPVNMEDFVIFNLAVKKASSALDDLIDGSKALNQMVALIDQNKSQNHDFNKINPKKAIENINKLKAKVDQSNAKYDQSLSHFNKGLKIRIAKVQASVKELSSKFEQIPFSNTSTHFMTVLEKLQQILPSIEKLEQEANKIHQIESQLSLELTDMNQIHSLYKKCNHVKDLWECKQKWIELRLEIENKHYKEIDCKELKEKWEEFSRKNNELQKSLYDNEVLRELIIDVCDFENLLETITALTSPNLEEKSWREISEYLAYELGVENQKQLPFNNQNDPIYTVEWLSEKQISLYKEKISFIVQKSQKEKQLQANFGEFRTFISTIKFEPINKKREVVLIERNQTLRITIKQKIAILYSLIGNQYSDALKNDAQLLIKHYEYMEQILENIYTFKDDWEKYEPFFENNAASAKLLSKESKEFGSWEMQWKKIIKGIINDPAYFYKKICDQTLGVNCSRAIIKSINKNNMLLDMIKKGIQQFLEKKRLQFPRYCLFTDEELLKILSKIDVRQMIVPQLIPILYDNIKSIEYTEESGQIQSVTVTGHDNHKFVQVKPSAFKSQSEMEDLLKTTEEQIGKTIASVVKTTFNKYIEEEISREALLKDNNLQVALLVDFIAWVRLAEETYLIHEPVGTMQDWLHIQQQQIQEVSELLHTCKPDQYFKHLQFMVQSIYFRQKTISLTKQNITDTSFYEWQRIPKMIMTSNSEVYLRQLESKIPYNYGLLNQKDLVVIQAETEKVWINLINAIAAKDGKNVIGLDGNNIEIVKDLAFYLGQSVKSVKISDNCNIKTVQRLLTGYMYLGCWMHFLPIHNTQILSYIAYHIGSQKRSNNFESTSSTLQVSRSNSLTSSFSNTVFLFEAGDQLVHHNLIDSKNFRNITLAKPDLKYLMSVLCEAQKIPKEFGLSIINICDFCRETFEFRNAINHDFERKILKQIKDTILPKLAKAELADQEVIDYIVVNFIEQSLSVYFTEADKEIYLNLKQSMSSNFALASKLRQRMPKKIENFTESHPVNSYLKANLIDKKFTAEFISQAIKIYDMLNNKTKFGIIISGQVLSGKSEMISFLEKVHRQTQKNSQQFKVNKLYPNAYSSNEILKSNCQEKKEKKQKTEKNDKFEKEKIEKINDELGIIQNFLRDQSAQKWIILDGKIEKQLLEFTQEIFDNLIVPNYGLISKEKYHKLCLQKVKFIIETVNPSDFSPSIFYNYSVSNISQSSCTIESLVQSFFSNEQTKKYLRSLNKDSIQNLESTLITNLQKVELKGNIKSKSLDFLYPFSDNEITIKCLKMIECIFKLNQESIREKEKNMKKTIEKFVNWVILMVLFLHVEVENRQKLEKKYIELCKCENMFEKSVINNIVYPGSGIEVHPMNGLRMQSSLFEIPERGMLTLNTKIGFSDFHNFMSAKNKLYDEISPECTSSIRVNNDESNLFNYYSQLFSYSNQPLVLTGPIGTGKKSILELYAKNIRNKAVVHSIRYNNKLSLMEMFEKPYRRYNSIDGIILKSVSVTKNVVVFVEDFNLTLQENKSLEFLRMLTNENKFINKNGQSRKLTQENNTLCILSNRMNIDDEVLRVATRLMFFQTTQNSADKISSIFSPYLRAWGKSNNLAPEVERIFNSPNNDTLLDATIKVMESMEQAFKLKKSEGKYSFDTLLLRPRIGDISKVLSCICMTQEANTLNVGYYAQLWANEIMRVFQDRLSPEQKDISNALIELIKKEFFLKFKENFQYNPNELFIFSSYLSPGENKFYEKIYNLEYLQEMLSNAYDSQEITVPVKFFFVELLKEIMKVHRVLQMTNGHMILLHLNKKVRQYLIELASQVAKAPFIQLKQNTLTIEKEVMRILELETDVSVFQDIDDMTEDQIYQFTCLLNKNYFDYEMKPETREKLKNKISKYIKQMLGDINAARQTVSQPQKSKNDGIKEKQNAYLNLKVQEQLQSTMQELLMNNVHFMFGASPANEKTRKFLLNEPDLIGQMHFSFFNIPQESLLQTSKEILNMEEQQEESKTQQNIANSNTQLTKQRQQITQRILQKCMKIYNSLPDYEQNYNALLCVCQNIISQKQRLQKESQKRIDQLSRTIQNYYKAQKLITQNQQKLTQLTTQIDTIKAQQSVLKQKMEDKDNEINELKLSVTQNGENNEEDEQKKLNIQVKKDELEEIENELRDIKMKRDKNDSETKLAKKIIQISKSYIELIENVNVVEHELNQEKAVEVSIESLLTLWWSVVLYSANKSSQNLIDDLNAWMKLIDFEPNHPVATADDVISTFDLIISPIGSGITAWESISPQIKLKGVILIYTLMHHEETTSANRIITLYDPSKIYASLFGFYLTPESELGNYSKTTIIDKKDGEMWVEIDKHRKGLIFFEETIDSREKKEIQAHIIKGRIINMNRIVSLVNKREKADISFLVEKSHLINELKLSSLNFFEPARAAQFNQRRQEYIKESRKLRDLITTYKSKRQEVEFEMQGDSQELGKLKTEIKQLETKVMVDKSQLKLSDTIVRDEFIIKALVDGLFAIGEFDDEKNVRNRHMMVYSNIEKLYLIVKEKVARYLTELRTETLVSVKLQSSISGKEPNYENQPTIQVQNQQFSCSESQSENSEYSQVEIKQIGEFIRVILQNNFLGSQQVQGDELLSLHLLSLELEQKIPVVVVQNNLLNYAFFHKENRPVNLLYNGLANVVLESISLENGSINNKTLLFYNDSVHFNVLMELVAKYQEDFKAQEGKSDKKHCIYLFTNSALPLLTSHQYLPTANYKLFFYQTKTSKSDQKSILTHQLNEKSTKTQLFIKLSENLLKNKFYNNLAEVDRYSEHLINKNWSHLESNELSEKMVRNQLKKYLLDITCQFANNEEILEKILTNHISFEDINKLSANCIEHEETTKAQNHKKSANSQNFTLTSNISKMILDEVEDELPYLFNTSDFMTPTNKDSISTEIQNIANNYNRKIKQIKSILEQNLKEYTLVLNKLPSNSLYTMPTKSYIKELNKEYKTIKKLLTQNGMLIGPSPSMGKIVSTKGLNFGPNSEPSIMAKNCMCLENMYFSNRMLNQIKIRAAKKLKIPFNRVRLLYALERKSQNIIHPNCFEKMINNSTLDITLAINATLMCGEFNNATQPIKEEKVHQKNVSMINYVSNKPLRILIIPYDTYTVQESPSIANLSCLIGQILAMGNKKKTGLDTTRKEDAKDKNTVEMTKVKVILEQGHQSNYQEIGVVEIPSSEIHGDNLSIVSPKIVISCLDENEQ